MNFHLCKASDFLLALILSLAPHQSHAASYAPLNCEKATTAAEATVCKDYALGQGEARQATLFEVLTSLVAMGQRADLIDEQRRWVGVREGCGRDEKCLSRVYQAHIEELSQALETLAKRAPF